jgi:TolA-binding protein
MRRFACIFVLVFVGFTFLWLQLDWAQGPRSKAELPATLFPDKFQPGAKKEGSGLPSIFLPEPKLDFQPPPQDGEPPLSPEEAALIAEPPSPQAILEYEKACALFDNGSFESAGKRLEEYLRKHPRSEHAAEAAFKLAGTFLLAGKQEEAKAAYHKLVADYFGSTWAKLALVLHFDAKQFLEVVDETYQIARKARKAPQLLSVFQTYQIFLTRFPEGDERKEAIFKSADCAYLVGEMDTYRDAMKALLELDKEGTWGTLTRFRMGDAECFRTGMKELIEVNEGAATNAVFLELAERYFESLPSEDKVKCRFYQARCFDDKKTQRGLYEEILKKHPKSIWAPESLFWLAELDYSEKKWSQAKARYLELAARYGGSPRAALAKRWVAWIDTMADSSAELTKIGNVLARRLSEWQGGVGFSFRKETSSKAVPWEVRVAYQADDLLVRACLGQSTLLLAQNKKGIWYQRKTGEIQKLKEAILSGAAPKITCSFDPKADKASCFFWLDTDAARPVIDISPKIVPYTVDLIQRSSHVAKEKRGDHVVFVFESPRWNPKETLTLEVEFDRAGMIRQARCCWPEEDGTLSWITLTDIKIGEILPQEAFDVAIPPDTSVRDVDQVNQFEVFGHAMNMLGAITGPIQSKLRKK